MSGVSIIGFAVGGAHLAAGLGVLLSLDPAEAAARNDRIRRLTGERRSRRAALECAITQAANDRERLAQSFVTAKVDAAGANAVLSMAGLPPDPGLTPPAHASEVDRWCASIPQVIAAARRRAQDSTVEHAMIRLAAALSEARAGQAVSAADILGPDVPGPAPKPLPDQTTVLARMLATLDARAGAADRAAIDAAAQAAALRPDPAYLVQLRQSIQEVNDRLERRRDDAITAAQLLDAMSPYRPEHGLDPDRLDRVRLALSDVVAGRRELDDPLLDQVSVLREQVEALASTATVTDALADVLTEFGYLVGPDFSVGEAAEGMLEISRPGDSDHLVRMRVDAETRNLVAMVYRAAPDGQAAEADTAAEAAWCADLDRALARLASSGLALTPVLLTAPGSKPTPVIATSTDADQARETTKYRTNKRAE
jgi:hypothetical protein